MLFSTPVQISTISITVPLPGIFCETMREAGNIGSKTRGNWKEKDDRKQDVGTFQSL